MKRIQTTILVLMVIVCVSLAACSSENTLTSTAASASVQTSAAPQTIKIGCVAATRPVVEIMQTAIAGTRYNVEIVVFDGNNLPAEALKAGDLEGIFCNSLKWIGTFNQTNNTNLVMPFPYFYSYQGLYSQKWKSIQDFPQNATIVIPQGLSNVDQALKILQQAGLIKLGTQPSENGFYSIIDIVDNPKNIRIMASELTTAMSSIEDVDGVVASAVIVRDSGKMDPGDHLAISIKENLSPMGLIVQSQDEKSEWVTLAGEKMQTATCYDEFNARFGGTFILYDEIDQYFK